MRLEIELAPEIADKLKQYCATHGVSEQDVVEHVLEEWHVSISA